MTDVIVYGFPISTFVNVVRLVLTYKNVAFDFHDLEPEMGGPAHLALRWEAIGPSGELFPTLDADIALSPAGEHATTLTLAGVYRPAPGNLGGELDQVVLRRVAEATIHTFVNRIAEAIIAPARRLKPGGGITDEGWFWPPTADGF